MNLNSHDELFMRHHYEPDTRFLGFITVSKSFSGGKPAYTLGCDLLKGRLKAGLFQVQFSSVAWLKRPHSSTMPTSVFTAAGHHNRCSGLVFFVRFCFCGPLLRHKEKGKFKKTMACIKLTELV